MKLIACFYPTRRSLDIFFHISYDLKKCCLFIHELFYSIIENIRHLLNIRPINKQVLSVSLIRRNIINFIFIASLLIAQTFFFACFCNYISRESPSRFSFQLNISFAVHLAWYFFCRGRWSRVLLWWGDQTYFHLITIVYTIFL